MPCMRIPELYSRPKPTISFEFFPPKSDEAEALLFRDAVPALKLLEPAFISVTYGAGGSTRERTLRVVRRLLKESGVLPLAHLTCVGATPQVVTDFLDEAAAFGIEN